MKLKPKSLFIQSCAVTSLLLVGANAMAADVTNGYTTNNGRIAKVDSGKEQNIQLHGVNWFGFNTAVSAPHGLWGGQSGNYVTAQYNTDLRTMIDRIKDLGFNSVRLPFVFANIKNSTPNFQDNQWCPYSPNPGEQDKPNPNPALDGQGCNQGFKSSGYEQNAWGYFQYVVEQLTNNGIYVLLDNHYEETLYPNETNRSQWLNEWKTIAETFKDNPYVIGYDVFNEPDSKGLQWPVWGPSAVEAAKMIHNVSPDKLIFIEGTGQGSFGANWGTGFKITDMSYDDARNPMQYLFDPLFEADAKQPGLLDQVVISPHVYGMDGTNGQANPALYDNINNYDDIFGYLNKEGVCTNVTGQQQCHVFPLAIGEFGATFGQYKSPFSADGDEHVMNIIGAYMKNANVPANSNDPEVQQGNKYHVKKAANGKTNNHNRIYDYYYWSWNPNSGNTGGILGSYEPESSSLDQGNWTDVVWKKVGYLNFFLGLDPNSNGSDPVEPPPPVEKGQLCVVINKDEENAPGLQETNFQPISVQGTSTTFELTPTKFGSAVCDSVNPGPYTINKSTLYGDQYQYDSTKQSADVDSNKKSTSTVSYVAIPIQNMDIRVSGLQDNQTSTVTLTNSQTNKTYNFTFTNSQDNSLSHVEPGTYDISASNIDGTTTSISPSQITVQPGNNKVSVLISYIPEAGDGMCTIQFKEQGGTPNQWYPNAQYTFKVNVNNVATSNPTDDWKLHFQFGNDVVGVENFWNMQKPNVTDKIPGSNEPFILEVAPVANWQAFGPSNPLNFDNIGYIEKLDWRDNFQTGVNTIPNKVTLNFAGETLNCTPSLVE